MADYPTTPDAASTPEFSDFPRVVPVLAPAAPRSLADNKSAAEIEQLLATLEAIPREELPDGGDRRWLAKLIRYGLVDNLYRPFGANYHNIAWVHLDPRRDPRERISVWLEARRRFWSTPNLGKLTPDEMLQRIKVVEEEARHAIAKPEYE